MRHRADCACISLKSFASKNSEFKTISLVLVIFILNRSIWKDWCINIQYKVQFSIIWLNVRSRQDDLQKRWSEKIWDDLGWSDFWSSEENGKSEEIRNEESIFKRTFFVVFESKFGLLSGQIGEPEVSQRDSAKYSYIYFFIK